MALPYPGHDYKKHMPRLDRMEQVNLLLLEISEHGRRFFSLKSDRPDWTGEDRVSRFHRDGRFRFWFIDKWGEQRICLASPGNWRGFSEGGTLMALVKRLYRYIMTGEQVPSGYFGPAPSWCADGDPWGYGDDMQLVRDRAAELGITSGPSPQPSVDPTHASALQITPATTGATP